mgnify:CR=1 FL=1
MHAAITLKMARTDKPSSQMGKQTARRRARGSTALAIGLGAALLTGAINAQADYINQLTNPGAEDGDLSGWTLIEDWGDGWDAGSHGTAHSGSNSFATSYSWNRRSQEIDLVEAGFSEAQLDNSPDIAVGEWIAGVDNASVSDDGVYYLEVELRDDEGSTVATWNVGSKDSPESVAPLTDWFEESHTFSGYSSGVRSVYFEDGGHDGWLQWLGHYGPRFDDAFVRVETAIPEPNTLALLALGAAGVTALRRRQR